MSSAPARVLVTGIGGFIGCHLLEHILVETDWQVVGIDSFRHKGLTERITDSRHYQADQERVEVYTHDLRAPISPLLEEFIGPPGSIDCVFHLASESHVDRSIAHPVDTIRNNVDVTLTMLEWARRAKPRQFIQVSTDEVYGPAPRGTRHVEWSPIVPSNPYSASKAAQEATAIAYWRTYGVPVVLTNTMNNFGERQDPEKFVPSIMRDLMRGEAVPIHHQLGEIGSRYWLHARNHASALLHVARLGPASPPGGRPRRVNIVGDVELTNLELAAAVANHMGVNLAYELVDHHTARPGHDLRYALDGGQLHRSGWRAPLDFEQSLQKTVSWYLRHPSWLEL